MDVAQPQGLCGLYFYAPLTENKEEGRGIMVPTPTRFPTKSLYTPMDNAPLFNAVARHTVSVTHASPLLSVSEQVNVSGQRQSSTTSISAYQGVKPY